MSLSQSDGASPSGSAFSEEQHQMGREGGYCTAWPFTKPFELFGGPFILILIRKILILGVFMNESCLQG